jgi:uncharacterized protein (DUF2267 family)
MRYDEFLHEVRELGEYADQDEAERVAHAVLGTLAPRLPAESVAHLAAQLPDPLSEPLRRGGLEEAESFGVEEYLDRVAAATGARPLTAEWDASATLTAVAENVSGGELDKLLSQLPSDFATLFGHPELSG